MLIYLQMMEGEEERTLFEQVYLRYRGLMFCVANRILRNDRDAEDAVQEAFVSLAENISKISEAECPKTRAYVVTIAENKAIDQYRRKRHLAEGLDERAVGIPAPQDGDGSLAAAIARLPARYRAVILLRYDGGYTGAETAKMLGLSQSAVQKLEQRAKARLKKMLEEEGVTL